MRFMKIKIFFLLIFLFSLPLTLLAQSDNQDVREEIFKARVIKIIDQNKSKREDRSISIQQILSLKGLEGQFKDKELIFDGTKFDVLSAAEYKVGDTVLVNFSAGPEGEQNFYVIGYSRTSPIYWLAILFVLVAIIIGRVKGLRALLALSLTFIIILKFIIPRILNGSDPLTTSIIGSLFILILAIYITEGIKKTSTISIISIVISLFITGLLAIWFSAFARLTGFSSEEAVYLTGLAGGNINIKGLMLAGIIIGALGVLDDIIIAQVALVKELKISNPQLSKYQIYSQAMRVGVSHLSSMINTLFLAYAGASLPLLILFSVKQPPFLTFSHVLDNEMIATEIVRTITGSIGLILSVPISTFLAAQLIKIKNDK